MIRVAFYYGEIARCRTEISVFEDVRSMCQTLRTSNQSFSGALPSLSSSYSSAIKFEDPGSIQSKISLINSGTAEAIEAISSACSSRIEQLNQDIGWYQQQNAAETRRLAAERLARQNNIAGGLR